MKQDDEKKRNIFVEVTIYGYLALLSNYYIISILFSNIKYNNLQIRFKNIGFL